MQAAAGATSGAQQGRAALPVEEFVAQIKPTPRSDAERRLQQLVVRASVQLAGRGKLAAEKMRALRVALEGLGVSRSEYLEHHGAICDAVAPVLAHHDEQAALQLRRKAA
jgi:hypothetical protein